MNKISTIAALLSMLGLSLLAAPSYAQPAPAEDVRTAVDAASSEVPVATSPLGSSLAVLLAEALNDSPEMRVAILRSGAAGERIQQAAARFYPSIDFQVTAQSTELYDTFSGITASGTVLGETLVVDVERESPQYIVKPALELSYDLYTGGRDSALLRNSKSAFRADAVGVELQAHKIMREVTLGYLRLGQAWHRWKTAQRWVEVARNQEKATEKHFAAGRASELEVNTVALTRAQRELDVQSKSESFVVAYTDFLRALGRPIVGLALHPKNEASFFENFEAELNKLQTVEITKDGSKFTSAEGNHEFERAHTIALAANELVTVEKASHLPQVRLSAQYVGAGRDDGSIGSAIEDISKESYVVGLTVSWNLFSGHETRARVAEARLNATRLFEEAAEIQNRLASARKNLASVYARAKARLEYAQQHREVEALRLKVEQAKLNVGRGFTEDVEQAQMALVAADADILDKRIDVVISQVKLRFALTQDMSPEGSF
ncbi:MAG: TolC family protein [Ketobacter sp.]|nr:TolC family protein [Ketobacter sp.]